MELSEFLDQLSFGQAWLIIAFFAIAFIYALDDEDFE